MKYATQLLESGADQATVAAILAPVFRSGWHMPPHDVGFYERYRDGGRELIRTCLVRDDDAEWWREMTLTGGQLIYGWEEPPRSRSSAGLPRRRQADRVRVGQPSVPSDAAPMG